MTPLSVMLISLDLMDASHEIAPYNHTLLLMRLEVMVAVTNKSGKEELIEREERQKI